MIPSISQYTRTLYFYKHVECAVCKAAEPILDAWAAQHKHSISVIKLDVAYKDWDLHGFKPKATPAYLFVVNREPVLKHIGALKEKDLDRILKAISL